MARRSGSQDDRTDAKRSRRPADESPNPPRRKKGDTIDRQGSGPDQNPDRNGFDGSYDDRDEQGRHISREEGPDKRPASRRRRDPFH